MRDDFRKEEAIQVQDILRGKPTSQLKYAKPTDTVEEVACRLRIENVGAVPILDDRGDIVGMIAERDVVRAIADFGSRALSMPCTEVVSRDIETCNHDDTMGREWAVWRG